MTALGYRNISVPYRFIGPAEMWNTAGSPSLAGAGTSGRRSLSWLCDAASEEGVGNTIMLPVDWTTISVVLYWANEGAGAGDVVWRMDYTQYVAGATADAAETTGANVTATAGAQNVLVASTLHAALSVDPSKLFRFEVTRTAADAADTLANDAGIRGLLISKA